MLSEEERGMGEKIKRQERWNMDRGRYGLMMKGKSLALSEGA